VTRNIYSFYLTLGLKVIRVFEATKMFMESLQNITGIDMSDILNKCSDDEPSNRNDQRALGANVPPLGLSNKPVYSGISITYCNCRVITCQTSCRPGHYRHFKGWIRRREFDKTSTSSSSAPAPSRRFAVAINLVARNPKIVRFIAIIMYNVILD